jgi:hypothetical protein
MRRLCRQCRSELGVDDEACRVCGARNPVPLPWYTPVLGAAMLAIIVWLLVDVEAVVRLLNRE